MQRTIVSTPETLDQLTTLYHHIARAASPEIAERCTNVMVDHREGLDTFPLRSNSRNDIRAGLRITHFKSRAVIVFDVSTDHVSIIGIFYSGQNYETLLQSDLDG